MSIPRKAAAAVTVGFALLALVIPAPALAGGTGPRSEPRAVAAVEHTATANDVPWPPSSITVEGKGPYHAPGTTSRKCLELSIDESRWYYVQNCSSYFRQDIEVLFFGGGVEQPTWAFEVPTSPHCLGLIDPWNGVQGLFSCKVDRAARWRVIHAFNNHNTVTNPFGGWHQVWRNEEFGTCMAISQTAHPKLVGKDCDIFDPAQWIRTVPKN